MPLAKPIVAVVALFTFIGPFTDFILASIILRTPENYTLAVGLYEMVAKKFGNEFTTFAGFCVNCDPNFNFIPITTKILYFWFNSWRYKRMKNGTLRPIFLFISYK